jgi:Skp family chaperone for outer membrane proteins
MNTFFESKIFKILLPLVLLAGVIYASVVATLVFRAPTSRIGYVDAKALADQYPAAVKAQKLFEQRTGDLKQKNLTLQAELSKLQQDFMANRETWDRAKLAAKEMEFRQKQENYQRFAQSANATAQQLQQELLQPVFTEMRAKIAEFGKAQGYSLIFESTDGGMILYGDKGNDVTDAFLKYAQVKN